MAAPPPPPALQSVGRAAAPAQRLRIVHGGVWSEENVLTTLPRARLAAASRRKRKPIESRSSCPHCANNEKDRRGSRHLRSPGTREIERASVRVQVHVNNSITHPSIFSPHIVYTRIWDTGRNGFDEYTTTRAGPLFSFSRISWTRTRGRLAIHPR